MSKVKLLLFISLLLLFLPAGLFAEDTLKVDDQDEKKAELKQTKENTSAPSDEKEAEKKASGPPPRAVLPETSHDFGMLMAVEQTVEHDFTIINEGKGDLEILQVKPG